MVGPVQNGGPAFTPRTDEFIRAEITERAERPSGEQDPQELKRTPEAEPAPEPLKRAEYEPPQRATLGGGDVGETIDLLA